jgi:hypothetical protein
VEVLGVAEKAVIHVNASKLVGASDAYIEHETILLVIEMLLYKEDTSNENLLLCVEEKIKAH